MSIQFKIFFVLMFTFGLAEGILRFLKPAALQYYRDVKLIHTYHPEYGVALAPNVDSYIRHHAGLWEGKFSTNSLGHRATREIDPNQPKIVCLGDSLVMGFGVSDSETFCALLDNQVIHGTKYQAVNLGVDAYGTVGFFKRLQEQIPHLPKTKIVLLFISPNDFAMPEALAKQGLLPDDTLDALHENDENWKRNFQLQFEATRFSYLLQTIKLSWEQNKISILQLLGSTFIMDSSWLKNSFVSSNTICSLKKKKSSRISHCPEPVTEEAFLCPLSKPPEAKDLEPLPEITIRYYKKIIELSKKHSFQLVPVIVPSQIEEIYCEQNGKYHPLGNYAIRAKHFFQNQGLSSISIMPYAKNMCQVDENGNQVLGIRDFFIPGDGHLTTKGNQWVFESLLSELRKGLF